MKVAIQGLSVDMQQATVAVQQGLRVQGLTPMQVDGDMTLSVTGTTTMTLIMELDVLAAEGESFLRYLPTQSRRLFPTQTKRRFPHG